MSVAGSVTAGVSSRRQRRPSTAVVGVRATGRSRLDDDRDDHRAAAVALVHPAADHPAHDLLQLVGVADPLGGGLGDRVDDLGQDRVEDRVVLGEPAGVDLGPGDHLAAGRVDHDDDRDEALLAEDPPVLQVGLGDLPDARPVDVDVAALAPPPRSGPRRRPGRRRRRPRRGRRCSAGTPVAHRELAVGVSGGGPRRAPASRCVAWTML